MELAVGVLVGLVTGIAAWIVMYRLFAPRLRWSNVIDRTNRGPAAPGGQWRYSMVLRNGSRFRSAVAVNVSAWGRMPVVRPRGAFRTLRFQIPTAITFIPIMKQRRVRSGNARMAHHVYLRLPQIEPSTILSLPVDDNVRQRLTAGDVQLEELLQLGLQVQFVAWGYDATTGAFTVRESVDVKDAALIHPV